MDHIDQKIAINIRIILANFFPLINFYKYSIKDPALDLPDTNDYDIYMVNDHRTNNPKGDVMLKEINADEKKLLSARNPKEYIDLSFKSSLKPGRKAFITRMWLEKTKYTVEDIEYHRNRHPYWKERKLEGNTERTQKRFEEYNYSNGKKIEWDDEMLAKFITMNKKDKKKKYIYKDRELAKHFRCSIATIQHMRRKYNMAIKFLTLNRGTINNKRLLEQLSLGEGTLRAMIKKIR